MAHSSYIVGIIAMAIATIAILTFSTLAAADLLPMRGARRVARRAGAGTVDGESR